MKEVMEETKLTYVQINKEIYKKLKIEAIKRDKTNKEMLYDALDYWLSSLS